MKLWIAGGVGEHGRNCFYVQGKESNFLVDCGKMADMPEDPYPHLTPEQIRRLNAVFLTHSHADHTGALPWLYENGFQGQLIAADETLRQLSMQIPRSHILNELCPRGIGCFRSLTVQWGRSGHCAGSVWYRFTEHGQSIFFSGDYTENTQVYACDPIWDQYADLAVLDCAYGLDETPYEVYCSRLVEETQKLLEMHHVLLFPVPKYGRGLEILRLFDANLSGASYSADPVFLKNLAQQRAGGFWYRDALTEVPVQAYCGQRQGIVFVSDPQLRSADARNIAKQILAPGGGAVMTGTLEKGSYSAELSRQGVMVMLRYPVHLNYKGFRQLKENNHFARTIAYHSAEFSAEKEIGV